MPNTFVENRDAWLRMSEIDYIGQFVKTWLAFNAWYRSAYAATRDRDIIDEIKWQSNPILSKLRPMLEADGDEAAQFRAEIGLLHQRLENYELHTGKSSEKQRISLCNIFLREKTPASCTRTNRGYEIEVSLSQNRQVSLRIIRGSSCLVQQNGRYDVTALESIAAFQSLAPTVRVLARQMYIDNAPLWTENLVTYRDEDPNTREIKCGAYSFFCGKDALFAGVVEVVYLMRCSLFHGELAPTREGIACYEPAYRLVRRFIDCLS